MAVRVIDDWQQLAALAPAEGLEVLVRASNMRYRLMAGIWICVGMGGADARA